jgi:hypothetical protein
MADLIADTQKHKSPEAVRDHVLNILAQVYPDAVVDVQDAPLNDLIRLPHHAPVDYDDFHDGLWEDSEHIEHLIVTQNQNEITTGSTVRAIAHPCQRMPIMKYLVLASKNVQFVFDDVDSWFVEKCASLMANSTQENRLREALTAKDAFLRGITHQLRTRKYPALCSCAFYTNDIR